MLVYGLWSQCFGSGLCHCLLSYRGILSLKFIPQIHWWHWFAVWSLTICHYLNSFQYSFHATDALFIQVYWSLKSMACHFPKIYLIFHFYNTACNHKFTVKIHEWRFVNVSWFGDMYVLFSWVFLKLYRKLICWK